jgi:hypothetical protein
MIPKFYVESLPVSPEIVEEDLTATDVGDLVDCKMLLISFILLYSLIIGLWPVSFLCGFLLVSKYSMHCLMFESRACTLVQSTRSPTFVAARFSSTISGKDVQLPASPSKPFAIP